MASKEDMRAAMAHIHKHHKGDHHHEHAHGKHRKSHSSHHEEKEPGPRKGVGKLAEEGK